jgi:acetyltransferase-like isoleucine patch superfamily enzyme
MRRLLAVLLVVLPKPLKRSFARFALGWDIHPTAKLGLSLIFADQVTMGAGAGIGRFNVITQLEELRLGDHASIGSRNRIKGWAKSTGAFPHSPKRRCALIMGKYALITVGHEIDCCDRVELGDFAAIAGFNCTVLTHGLDMVRNRFVTAPVEIGEYAGILTNCLMLSGTRVPDRSVVSAGSVVATKLTKELTFYRGNPAEAVRDLPANLAIFHRNTPGEGIDDAWKALR